MEILKIVLIIAVGLFVVSYVLPLLLVFIVGIVARAVKAWKHRKTYSGDDNTLDYWEYNEVNFGEEEAEK